MFSTLPVRSAAICLRLVACVGLSAAMPLVASAQPGNINPMIRQDAAEQVSEHVWVIPDNYVSFVPNVGIVVGERATLIVDTGLGDANGAIVLQEARKLSDNETFYVTATHYHPEHDLGANAFPASARMVRWRGQQEEADSRGVETIARFAGISPVLAELLDGVEFRPPDILFDDSLTIDLGGVRVVATGVGPNHTDGDTVFWVEGDRVLFTGDVVMSVFPGVNAESGNVDLWLENLTTFNQLNPAVVVPAHGRNGGVDLIRRYRDYLETVRERVLARRRAGDSPDAAADALAEQLAADFADLSPPSGSPLGRINAAIRAAWRSGN